MIYSEPHKLILGPRLPGGEVDRAWEVIHCDDCPTEVYAEDLTGIDVSYYTCLVAWHFDGMGLDYLDQLPEGEYTIKAWFTPQSWAGSEPIDADGGIEVLDDPRV